MNDPTEGLRRAMIETDQPARDLAKAEQRWTTDELARDFTVVAFAAPFVVVRRKADGVEGTCEFTHSPRVYFNFMEDKR
jgi:hypothetical protein